MKKIYLTLVTIALATPFMTSCLEEIDPQSSTLTEKQVSESPGFFESSVEGLTANLAGQFT